MHVLLMCVFSHVIQGIIKACMLHESHQHRVNTCKSHMLYTTVTYCIQILHPAHESCQCSVKVHKVSDFSTCMHNSLITLLSRTVATM